MVKVKPRPGKRNGYHPPEEECSICHQIKRVYKRKNGKAICPNCAEIPQKKCAKCGKFKIINLNDPEIGPICIDCYEREDQICSICEQNGEIVKRTKKNKLICRKCYQPPKKECFFCGRKRALAIKNPPTCNTCYCKNRRNNNN